MVLLIVTCCNRGYFCIFLVDKNISFKFWGLFFILVVPKMVLSMLYFPEYRYQVENFSIVTTLLGSNRIVVELQYYCSSKVVALL